MKPIHLFRGAPAVRSWSKYQETVEEWTLCGIKRKKHGKGGGQPAGCTEDAFLVSCPYCRELMAPCGRGQPLVEIQDRVQQMAEKPKPAA